MKNQLKILESSYRNYYLKLTLFCAIALNFISAWDFSFMKFWKGFVVLHHEFFHALVVWFSGGEIYNLTITESEFGEVLGKVGFDYAVPVVYLSGYVGSIFLGFFLLHESLNSKRSNIVLTAFALYTTFCVLLFTKTFSYSMNFGLVWSVALLFLSILQNKFISNLSLTLLGIGISSYAVLDLKDFFYNIENTDLGKLSKWILKEIPNFPLSETILAYLFAGLILVLSLIILIYYSLKILKFNLSSDEKAIKKILIEYQKGNIAEDTANWFLENGLSLDGKKISKETIQNIYKKGEINE